MDKPKPPAAFQHQVCVYGSDAEFLSMAVPFVKQGLALGHPVLAVTTPGTIELLRNTLGDEARRMDVADAYGWYRRPATTLAAYHRYLQRHAGGRRYVRIIGEPTWAGCSARESAEWTRYEAALNVAFAVSRTWLVCPYNARALPGSIVADAMRTHPARRAGERAYTCAEYVDPGEFARSRAVGRLPPVPPDAATLPFAGDLYGVRRFAVTQATRNGVAGESLMAWVAVVGEIATYVMRHGSGRAAIRAWAEGASMVCDIHDPDTRLADPLAGYLPPTLRPRPGDGLWLARQICDVVEISSGDPGCVIRLRFSTFPVEMFNGSHP